MQRISIWWCVLHNCEKKIDVILKLLCMPCLRGMSGHLVPVNISWTDLFIPKTNQNCCQKKKKHIINIRFYILYCVILHRRRNREVVGGGGVLRKVIQLYITSFFYCLSRFLISLALPPLSICFRHHCFVWKLCIQVYRSTEKCLYSSLRTMQLQS